MLDWSSHMNRCGMVDLVVQGVAHRLFGRSPDRHRPHRRRANHRRGGARRRNPLGQVATFIVPPLRRTFGKSNLFDYRHQRTVLHVCDESRRDADRTEAHTVLPDAVRVHLAHWSGASTHQMLLLLVAEHGGGRKT